MIQGKCQCFLIQVSLPSAVHLPTPFCWRYPLFLPFSPDKVSSVSGPYCCHYTLRPTSSICQYLPFFLPLLLPTSHLLTPQFWEVRSGVPWGQHATPSGPPLASPIPEERTHHALAIGNIGRYDLCLTPEYSLNALCSLL